MQNENFKAAPVLRRIANLTLGRSVAPPAPGAGSLPVESQEDESHIGERKSKALQTRCSLLDYIKLGFWRNQTLRRQEQSNRPLHPRTRECLRRYLPPMPAARF